MKKIVLMIAFLIAPLFLLTSIGQPPPPPPQDIPIDGGLFFLLISGIILAVKFFYSHYNENIHEHKEN